MSLYHAGYLDVQQKNEDADLLYIPLAETYM